MLGAIVHKILYIFMTDKMSTRKLSSDIEKCELRCLSTDVFSVSMYFTNIGLTEIYGRYASSALQQQQAAPCLHE